MNRQIISTALALALAMLGAGSRAAPATLEATVSNLDIAFVDLDPTDQYTQSPFDLAEGRSYIVASAYVYPGESVGQVWQNVPAGTGRVDLRENFSQWAVADGALGASVRVHQQETGSGQAYVSFTQFLWVQPQTSVTFSGHFSASWRGDDDYDHAISVLLGQVGLLSYGGIPAERLDMSVHEPGEMDRDFSITWANTTDLPQGLDVIHGVYALYADSGAPPPPVPEPSSIAMLCAGALLLASRGRVRMRARATARRPHAPSRYREA